MRNNFKKGNFDNGFTMIELIVVITIIAVITVAGIVNFTEANKKARDNRRMSDLEKIRIALELIRQAGTTYPISTLGGTVPAVLETGGYLQDIPNGPKGDKYYYISTSSNFKYNLRASMEGLGNTTGSYAGSCGVGVTCNYQVTNP